ncbi:MAG TPA: Amuc_1100 family pilus-like protein [Verrucomicrobiae bacterium]|nr:Amuc_1100 family pilus-like protein [Verrucomicrobiae bacterium]
MNWIKRNLGFAVGGGIALLLLGGALFYLWQGMNRNSAAFEKLHGTYDNLKQLTSQKLSPGKNGTNTFLARQQEKQLREWIAGTDEYFQPIQPIPTNQPVNSEMFASSLRNTIARLQREAAAANVMLPPQYAFSFEAERTLVKFAPNGLPLLTTQLGEVKTISEILFAARVNGVDAIQRQRVSDDDLNGPQGDYIIDNSGNATPGAAAVAGGATTVTPYVVTFRSFSSEISEVLADFAASPHGFVIKNINVQPASAAPMGAMNPGIPGRGLGEEPERPMQPMPGAMPMRGGLQTVLKEQLLRVTMEVDIVKMQPKS